MRLGRKLERPGWIDTERVNLRRRAVEVVDAVETVGNDVDQDRDPRTDAVVATAVVTVIAVVTGTAVATVATVAATSRVDIELNLENRRAEVVGGDGFEELGTLY